MSSTRPISRTTIDRRKAAALRIQDCTLPPILKTKVPINSQPRLPSCRGILFDAEVAATVTPQVLARHDPAQMPGILFKTPSNAHLGGSFPEFFGLAAAIQVLLINFASEADLYRHMNNRAHLGHPRLIVDWPGVSLLHQFYAISMDWSALTRDNMLLKLWKSVWHAIHDFLRSHTRQIQAKGIALDSIRHHLRLVELRQMNDTTWSAKMNYKHPEH
ncbi:hypothetical protein Hypma_002478 [Hypsizygus marmoreus]|uniref:Uncharacterized protein n=1 Tax=Hypsizygus marmoreus TaxID=39966 RepID=A0A369J8E0_HYPMA|nr:hypothetical protein Hypma_002478 [Hypsizygus marmoreus]